MSRARLRFSATCLHICLTVLATLMATAAAPAAAADPDGTTPARLRLLQVDATGEQLNVYLRAENGAGDPASIANLRMTAEVDGKPLPLGFLREEDSGTAIVLLMDVSRSLHPSTFDRMRRTAAGLVGDAGAADRFSVVTAGATVNVASGFTGDRSSLMRTLFQLQGADRSSSLFAGLMRANGIANSPDPQLPRRRVIVAFTDGLADAGESVVSVAETLATQSVPIYTILATGVAGRRDTGAWTSLVTASQGAAIPLSPAAGDTAIAQLRRLIETSFHFQADCTVCPRDGSRMTVRVRTQTPDARLVSATLSVTAR